jgi:hypothetical protein
MTLHRAIAEVQLRADRLVGVAARRIRRDLESRLQNSLPANRQSRNSHNKAASGARPACVFANVHSRRRSFNGAVTTDHD